MIGVTSGARMAVIAASLVAFAACETTYGPDPDGLVGQGANLGKEKKLSFSARCCIRPGCVLAPFMRRTVDYVEVDGDELPFEIDAVSVDQNVFAVRTTSLTRVVIGNQPERASWKVYIETTGRGTAELQIRDKTGHLLDRIDVEVRDAARLGFSSSPTTGRAVTPVSKLALSVSHATDGAETLYVVAYDATEQRLDANAGFTFASRDEEVLGVKPGTDCVLTVCFGSGDRFGSIARAPGDTEIEVKGGDVVGRLPVTVAP